MIRELFVELSEQVLAAAIAQREESKPAESVSFARAAREHISLEYSIHEIAKTAVANGATWRIRDIYRRVDCDVTVLGVKLACGHRGWFNVDERVLVLDVETLINRLYGVLEELPHRKCCCVPYEPPAPCTAGVCQ